ncbi:MAG: hypothetical protein M3Q71_00105 [Chloroflexota bacterium]|nr:hypothetical protein [Chloroflexota bacterium]
MATATLLPQSQYNQSFVSPSVSLTDPVLEFRFNLGQITSQITAPVVVVLQQSTDEGGTWLDRYTTTIQPPADPEATIGAPSSCRLENAAGLWRVRADLAGPLSAEVTGGSA